jgi:hypothetical protein
MTAEPALLEVHRIWSQSRHNALTDLVRFREEWFCVFREGLDHASPGGHLRILRSQNGTDWNDAGCLSVPSADLRDPKLSVMPSGRLMIVAAAALHPPSPIRHQSLVWHSPDGTRWSGPVEIGEPDFWLWRVTWRDDTAYGMGYSTTDAAGDIRLYSSLDGMRFNLAARDLFTGGYPNEATLAFQPDGSALCLLRRDSGTASAQLGTAHPPYAQWHWKDLGVRVGGPHMIVLPDGRIVVGIRRYGERKAWTSLNWLDTSKPKLDEFLVLPSAGDTSYPGMCWHEGLLWVSYYSSHEDKTSIYLAKIQIP